jgi:hypothetical protein
MIPSALLEKDEEQKNNAKQVILDALEKHGLTERVCYRLYYDYLYIDTRVILITHSVTGSLGWRSPRIPDPCPNETTNA